MHVIPFLLDHLFEIEPDEFHRETRNSYIKNIQNIKRHTINGITLVDDGRIVFIGGINEYNMHIWILTSSNLKPKAISYWRVVKRWLNFIGKEHGLLLTTSKSSLSDRMHKMLGFKHLAGVTWCYDKDNRIK